MLSYSNSWHLNFVTNRFSTFNNDFLFLKWICGYSYSKIVYNDDTTTLPQDKVNTSPFKNNLLYGPYQSEH